MRIALLIGGLSGGGAELQFRLLAEGLASRGHEVHVLYFQDRDRLSESLELAGVRTHSLKAGSGFFASQMRLINTLRSLKVALLYAFLEASCFRASLAKQFLSGTKVVWGVRNSGVQTKDYPIKVRALERLLSLLSRSCDLAISNSHEGVVYASRLRINKEDVVVIPNGIKAPRDRTEKPTRGEVRARWGVPDDAFVFGLLARNDPMKGLEVLAESFTRVVAERRTAFLIVAGSGFTKDCLASTAHTWLGDSHVRMIGTVNPWSGFLEGIDALVSSSLYGEGFSNSIAEALLAGKPVVCTDVGDARRIVGEFGRVVPPGDPAALSAALLAQIDDSEDEELKNRRRSWIEEQFSVQRMVSNTENELLKLLNSKQA